ncbi:baseplate wedge protein [Gordonia phage Kabocha]|uniref:Baseplate wedge protein n=1 Tax=Gordonia phage Chidiebere TaxID=2656530 RepID=A0A649VKM2_9CAUD|nr:baseplate protein [Gordonia phage Chidiebere]AZS07909.1 baseplate wedge protein [Gordonia phage Gray]WAA19842.1 baseplate wedge protein [Gordonia phage Kabocha]WAA20032.1 baseplate wedge protein [Gordonia phage Hanem]WNM67075.1 baseplate wedge protein [Gordonia Phage Schomber]QGJ92946.1 baseplate wedge protein [Gordonia phage Chidiebere]
MTVQLLSFPFRVNKQGVATTEDDESDVYCAERLSIILGTRPGERPMAPSFGINDPAYGGFTQQALSIQVAQNMLPIDIQRVRRVILSDTQEHVTIEFSMAQGLVQKGTAK